MVREGAKRYNYSSTLRQSSRGTKRGKQKGADEVGGTNDAVRGAGREGGEEGEIMKGKRNDHTQDHFVGS